MNRLSIISAFLGGVRNRYMVYQTDRSLAERLEMAVRVRGVEGLELCYPEDFKDRVELRALLERYSLGVSAVNFRSRRTGQWWRGSFTSEHAHEREQVVEELKKAMDCAADLGTSRVTTCPLNDGADTLFEVDYVRIYDYALETLTAACAHNRGVRLCLEYKESDPRARCLLGTAGEAASFCQLSGVDNLGVTLDTGHALYAGERPAQAASLLARAGRLFYVHLNDNDGRWDWDMLPGAFHMWEFVEFFYMLRKLGYDDDWYAFDVYPKEIDTVQNFGAAVSLTRKLEALTDRIDVARMEQLLSERDASKTIPYLYSLL
jgi:xylose isomerase